MNQQPTPTVEVDEHAQIVVGMQHGSLVFRFKTLKRAQKAYDAIVKAQATWWAGKAKAQTHYIESDVLCSTILLSDIVCISFQDTMKHIKFRPYGYGN